MEPDEGKIDTFINYIRVINKNFELVLNGPTNNHSSEADKILKNFGKFVQQYEKKTINDMRNIKIMVSPFFLNSIS